ncbi:MAG: cardiolipin synthase [Clostridia bacterium]|nr:cardiolipin synthase [Clostridia bacterium]
MTERMKEKKSIKNSVGRACFVALSLILQVGWLVNTVSSAGKYFQFAAIGVQLLAMVAVVAIYSQNRSSASKMSWIVLILLFPVLGLLLFLLVGQPWATKTMRLRFENVGRKLNDLLPQRGEAVKELETLDPGAAAQMRYLQDWCQYPAYRNTQVEFHAQTDAAFEALKAELKKAKKFIFMEYHAIELSECFMEIEEILAERAKAGVEVRLFYDGVGSFAFINPRFVQRMEKLGIQCQVFNPLLPFISAFMNNRDHRKITVIDGCVGFTGGYNLADEYFNVKSPYGHWKDTGILLRGDAVRSLTVIFLEMWNAAKIKDADYSRYIEPVAKLPEAEGYVQPYADTPLDDERVGENVYPNLLKNARKYVWITTPYLILDEEMIQELTLAAKRGVDVRIITPGIPDKKLVYQLTRSYYAQLVKCGVRIFEYTPGFLHAKQMLADDCTAVVGTINLDYRSLYLHFENAVLLHRCPAIADIRRDFEDTFPLCREVTEEYRGKRKVKTRIVQSLLRLFAPLL